MDKTREEKQNGITLVALVITIIVMLILIGVTINIAITGGLFGTASDATKKMSEQIVYDQIVAMTEYTSNGYIDVVATYSAIQNKYGSENVSELGGNGVFTIIDGNETYTYMITNSKISTFSGNKNDYGFYYDIEYISDNFNPQRANDYSTIVFYQDGSTKTIVHEEFGWSEGGNITLVDMINQPYINIDSLEYNHEYTGTGSLGESYKAIVDSNGSLTTTVEIPSGVLTYSENTVSLGNTPIVEFSNNGTTLTYGGKTFTLSE